MAQGFIYYIKQGLKSSLRVICVVVCCFSMCKEHQNCY